MSEQAQGHGHGAPRQNVENSHFCLVADSEEAFVLRAATARLAQRTLDLQYYVWEDDRIGKLLVYRALEAARRGVKVRLLLDHANQLGRDVKWAALNAHPNVENAPRLNHRMHNKAWIVDGERAIVGGRNLSEHYFGVHPEANFRDLDIYARGPIVAETRAAFDAYWDSDVCVRLRSLRRRSRVHADRLWQQLVAWRKSLDGFPYRYEQDVAHFEDVLGAADRRQIQAPAALLFDPPDKAKGATQRLMGDQLGRLLGQRSLNEILIEASYFIPGDEFTAALADMHRNGCRVALLTNSLATNDVIAAHAAYARYRPALLRGGVEVHELQANARARRHHARLLRGRGRSKSSLHTKAMVLDRKELFVGSFNLDPRSVNVNTEMGYYVDSEALAGEVAAFVEEGMAPQNSYRVTSDDQGLLWGAGDERGPVQYRSEPRVSPLRRLASQLCALLPIENLL